MAYARYYVDYNAIIRFQPKTSKNKSISRLGSNMACFIMKFRTKISHTKKFDPNQTNFM